MWSAWKKKGIFIHSVGGSTSKPTPLATNRRVLGNNGGNFYFTALYRKLPTLCTPPSVNSTPKMNVRNSTFPKMLRTESNVQITESYDVHYEAGMDFFVDLYSTVENRFFISKLQ